MLRAFMLALFMAVTANAQWQMLETHSTAEFRGVSSVGKGVVWISGTNGTVLRSEDAGYLWQHCTTPPGAEHLDFRGIQAFDANTAIVMSSGRGDLSRLYKTSDGCQTWTLVFTNPDKDGFWDAISLGNFQLHDGPLLGDPVNGKFPIWWIVPSYPSVTNSKFTIDAHAKEAAFAASNSSIFVYVENFWIGTGGVAGARVIRKVVHGVDPFGWVSFPSTGVPIGRHTESSGIFSLAFSVAGHPDVSGVRNGVAVGGDYKAKDDATRIAAWTSDAGRHWKASETQPHGYRSAVAYDEAAKVWIAVGPNGTDVSTDDGRNWRPLKPIAGDAVGADRDWNALSLPYVVGPRGRVGMLEPAALPAK